jgi:hypothetical protein
VESIPATSMSRDSQMIVPHAARVNPHSPEILVRDRGIRWGLLHEKAGTDS